MGMRVFPRPKNVEVDIFGEKHVLAPISYVAGHELFVEFFENNVDPDAGSISFRKFFTGSAEAVDKVLRISFPTFSEWEAVPVGMALELLDLVVEENDLQKMVANFFGVRDKILKGLQAQSPQS